MAREHAERAIRLDPYDGSGYVGLAFTDFLGLDTEAAVRNARRAVELAPSMANAHLVLGYVLWANGEPAEALLAYDEFTRLSPRDPYLPWGLHGQAMAEFLLGRYEEALETEARALAIWSDWPQPYRLRAVALTLLGRHDEARAAARQALAIKPDETIATLRRRVPIADPEQNARYFDALRQAGFPE